MLTTSQYNTFLTKLYQENRMEEARAIQREANRIIAVLCSMGVMQAEKEILCQLGLDFGCCRHPFGKLGEEQKQLLRREVLPYITEVQQ